MARSGKHFLRRVKSDKTLPCKKSNMETVVVSHNADMNFTAGVHGHSITIDKENGPRPKALMLASLGGCTAFDVVSILNKMRVEFSQFSVSAHAVQTETEPSVYSRVILVYRIHVREEDKVKFEKAISLSKNKYCGVSRMFEGFADLRFEIEYI